MMMRITIVLSYDVTFTPSVPPSDFVTSDDVIESGTAATKSHLQTRERKKFMWDGKKDTGTGELIPGQQVMGDLVRSNFILIPIAIDPHGNWRPLTQNLLFHHTPQKELNFPSSHPHAAAIYTHELLPPVSNRTHPCCIN